MGQPLKRANGLGIFYLHAWILEAEPDRPCSPTGTPT
jgi:hypothetical protein